jgi:hypothetical protein
MREQLRVLTEEIRKETIEQTAVTQERKGTIS